MRGLPPSKALQGRFGHHSGGGVVPLVLGDRMRDARRHGYTVRQFGALWRFRVRIAASLWARTQKIAVARLRHPARSREMTVMDDTGAFRFAIWIQVEDDSDRLPPVSAFLVGVQQSQ